MDLVPPQVCPHVGSLGTARRTEVVDADRVRLINALQIAMD